MADYDLFKAKKIHIIGIEGAGTSALARMLAKLGISISGSDEGDHFYGDYLEQGGISVSHKFSRKNIPHDADLIIYGSAYHPENNVELNEAAESGKPLISYAEALGKVFNRKFGIAVCGTHGKSTVSAWLAFIMDDLGLKPNAVIGARVPQFSGNSLVGTSDYFVTEADEYQNKLRFLKPKGAILTSADFDHPDYFKDQKEYNEAFSQFVEKITTAGFLIVSGDSVDTLEIAKNCPANVISYGFSDENDFKITDFEVLPGQNYSGAGFKLERDGKHFGDFKIQLPGRHNVLNAAAVIVACHKLGLNIKKIARSLEKFTGVQRRFQFIGQYNRAFVLDDYAHHPEEIRAVLRAARESYPEKTIWAVFHPHTFTRTKALMPEFSQSFDDADKVIVLDIYGSARETQGGVHSQDLVKLLNHITISKAFYIPTIPETVEYLKENIGPDDVVMTIGAGDVWKAAEKLVESSKQKA